MNITEFEKKMGVVLKESGKDISKGIELGISIEMMGKDFYENKAKTIENENVKYLFHFLASEEKFHLSLLKDLKESLKKRKTWIDIKAKSKKPENFFSKQMTNFKNTDIDVVLTAMRTEKEFYFQLSEKVKDKKGKKFFEILSNFEKHHFEMLDDVLTNMTYNRIES